MSHSLTPAAVCGFPSHWHYHNNTGLGKAMHTRIHVPHITNGLSVRVQVRHQLGIHTKAMIQFPWTHTTCALMYERTQTHGSAMCDRKLNSRTAWLHHHKPPFKHTLQMQTHAMHILPMFSNKTLPAFLHIAVLHTQNVGNVILILVVCAKRCTSSPLSPPRQ